MFALERNGPIIANEMRVLAHGAAKRAGDYVVVSVAYDRARCRTFPHRTLKAAFRTLGSVCNSRLGKLNRRDDFAACIVTPDNRVMNWTEARGILSAGSPP